MGTGRHISAGSIARAQEQQQEVLLSLHAAVEALTACVDRIHELIERVNEMQEDGLRPIPDRSRRTRITYGGGPSTLAPREAHEAEATVPDPVPAEAARREVRTAGTLTREKPNHKPQTEGRALLIAAEMAHQGYSREEIAQRLRERWGEKAVAILRDVLE